MKKRYQRNHFKAFSNSVNKKKLYKKGKNWVVGSLTLLALAGLGVTANHTVHADGDANTKAATTSVGSTANIEHKAKAMYNGMIANQIANPSAGQPTQKGTTKPTSAKSNVASSSASQSSQSSSKASSVSAKTTASSTANKTTSSAKTTTPVKPGLGGANPLAKNQPSSTSSQGSANPSVNNSNSSVTPSASSSNGVNVKAAKSASQSTSADQSPIAKAAALHNAVDKHNLNAVKPKRELGGYAPAFILKGILNNRLNAETAEMNKATDEMHNTTQTPKLQNDYNNLQSDNNDAHNFQNLYNETSSQMFYNSAFSKANAFSDDYGTFNNDLKSIPKDPLVKDAHTISQLYSIVTNNYVPAINNNEKGTPNLPENVKDVYQNFTDAVSQFKGEVQFFNHFHSEYSRDATYESLNPSYSYLAQGDVHKSEMHFNNANDIFTNQIKPEYAEYTLSYSGYTLSNDSTNVTNKSNEINNLQKSASDTGLNALSASLTNDVNTFRAHFGNNNEGFISESEAFPRATNFQASRNLFGDAGNDYTQASAANSQVNSDYNKYQNTYSSYVGSLSKDATNFANESASISGNNQSASNASLSTFSTSFNADSTAFNNQYNAHDYKNATHIANQVNADYNNYSNAYTSYVGSLSNANTKVNNELATATNDKNTFTNTNLNNLYSSVSNAASTFNHNYSNKDYKDADNVKSLFDTAYTNYSNTYNSYKQVAALKDQVESLGNANNVVSHEESLINQYTSGISYSNLSSLSANLTKDSKALSTDYSSASGDYSTLTNRLNNTVLTSANSFVTNASLASYDFASDSSAYNKTLLSSLSAAVGSVNADNSSNRASEAEVNSTSNKFTQTQGMATLSGDIYNESNAESNDYTQLSNDYTSLNSRLNQQGVGATLLGGVPSSPLEGFGGANAKTNDANTNRNNLNNNYNNYMKLATENYSETGNYRGFTYKYDPVDNSVEFTGGKADSNDLSNFLMNAPANVKNANSITFDANADVSNVTNMQGMFAGSDTGHDDTPGNTTLHTITLNGFNTKNVTNMTDMFAELPQLHHLNLSQNFDTTHANTMSMFEREEGNLNPCLIYAKIPNLKKFTPSDASDIRVQRKMVFTDSDGVPVNPSSTIFWGPVSNSIDLYEVSQYYQGKLPDFTYNYTAIDNNGNPVNYEFQNIQLSSDTTTPITVKVKPMYRGMYYKYNPATKSVEFTKASDYYNEPENIDPNSNPTHSDATSLSDFMSSEHVPNVVKDAKSITFDSDIDFSKVTNMNYMFADAPNLQSVVFKNDNGDFANLKDVKGMFQGDKKLSDVSLPLTASDITDGNNLSDMSDMFNGDSDFPKDVQNPNVKNWDFAQFSDVEAKGNGPKPASSYKVSRMFKGTKLVNSKLGVDSNGTPNMHNGGSDIKQLFNQPKQYINYVDYLTGKTVQRGAKVSNSTDRFVPNNGYQTINSSDQLDSDITSDNDNKTNQYDGVSTFTIPVAPKNVRATGTWGDYRYELTNSDYSNPNYRDTMIIEGRQNDSNDDNDYSLPSDHHLSNDEPIRVPILQAFTHRDSSDVYRIHHIVFKDGPVNAPSDSRQLLSGMPNLQTITNLNGGHLDFARHFTSDISYLFGGIRTDYDDPAAMMTGCADKNLYYVQGMSDWGKKSDPDQDLKYVTNMAYAFANTGFKTLNLSNWDPGNSYISDTQLKLNMYPKYIQHKDGTTDVVPATHDSDWAYNTDYGINDMFSSMPNVQKIVLGKFDTSQCHRFDSLFVSDPNLSDLDLGPYFNTQNAGKMYNMFTNDIKLNSDSFHKSDETNPNPITPSNFNTSKVTDMHQMFEHTGFNTLKLGNWQTPSCYDMSEMFSDDPNLKNLDISNFDTRDKAGSTDYITGASHDHIEPNNMNLNGMFDQDLDLQNLNLGSSTFITPDADLVSPWMTTGAKNTSDRNDSDYKYYNLANASNNDLHSSTSKANSGHWTRDADVVNYVLQGHKVSDPGAYQGHHKFFVGGHNEFTNKSDYLENWTNGPTVLKQFNAASNNPKPQQYQVVPGNDYGQAGYSFRYHTGSDTDYLIDKDPNSAKIYVDFVNHDNGNSVIKDHNGNPLNLYGISNNGYSMFNIDNYSSHIKVPAGWSLHVPNGGLLGNESDGSIGIKQFIPNNKQIVHIQLSQDLPDYIQYYDYSDPSQILGNYAFPTGERNTVDHGLSDFVYSHKVPNDFTAEDFSKARVPNGYRVSSDGYALAKEDLLDPHQSHNDAALLHTGYTFRIPLVKNMYHTTINYYDTTTGQAVLIPGTTIVRTDSLGTPYSLISYLQNHRLINDAYVLDGGPSDNELHGYSDNDTNPIDSDGNKSKFNNPNRNKLHNLAQTVQASDRTIRIYVKKLGQIQVNYFNMKGDKPSDQMPGVQSQTSPIYPEGSLFDIHSINSKTHMSYLPKIDGYHIDHISDANHNSVGDNSIIADDVGINDGKRTITPQQINVHYAPNVSSIHIHFINAVTGKPMYVTSSQPDGFIYRYDNMPFDALPIRFHGNVNNNKNNYTAFVFPYLLGGNGYQLTGIVGSDVKNDPDHSKHPSDVLDGKIATFSDSNSHDKNGYIHEVYALYQPEGTMSVTYVDPQGDVLYTSPLKNQNANSPVDLSNLTSSDYIKNTVLSNVSDPSDYDTSIPKDNNSIYYGSGNTEHLTVVVPVKNRTDTVTYMYNGHPVGQQSWTGPANESDTGLDNFYENFDTKFPGLDTKKYFVRSDKVNYVDNNLYNSVNKNYGILSVNKNYGILSDKSDYNKPLLGYQIPVMRPQINIHYVDDNTGQYIASLQETKLYGNVNAPLVMPKYRNEVSDYGFHLHESAINSSKSNKSDDPYLVGMTLYPSYGNSDIPNIYVHYSPDTANIHVYYEDTDTGREISGYPESLASSATNASFNVAPYVKTISGYHFINSMHPATSYDANNDETHTIDLIYAPNTTRTSSSASATDTVNYLISGTNSVVASSSTDSIEFSRAVASVSGSSASYGNWTTGSAFGPVTYGGEITSNGKHYHEVSANTALPTPSQVSDDLDGNRAANFTNDVYYVSDGTANGTQTANVNETIDYILYSQGGSSVASVSNENIQYSRPDTYDATNGSVESVGSWSAKTNFSLPNSYASSGWTAIASNVASPDVTNLQPNENSSFSYQVDYLSNSTNFTSTANTSSATETINYYENNSLFASSSSAVTVQRSEYNYSGVSFYTAWSAANSFTVPTSSTPAGWKFSSVNGWIPANTNNVQPGSYTENVYYAPDSVTTSTQSATVNAAYDYVLYSQGGSSIASTTNETVTYTRPYRFDVTLNSSSVGSWVANASFTEPASYASAGWHAVASNVAVPNVTNLQPGETSNDSYQVDYLSNSANFTSTANTSNATETINYYENNSLFSHSSSTVTVQRSEYNYSGASFYTAWSTANSFTVPTSSNPAGWTFSSVNGWIPANTNNVQPGSYTENIYYVPNNVAPESAAVTETTYDEWNNGRTNVSEAASATTYHYTRNGSLVYDPATKNYSDHYSDWKLLNNSSTSNRSINLNGYYYETTVGNLPSAATLQNLAPNANVSYSDYQLYAPNSASYTNSAVSGAATETVNYYENGSLVSTATYTSGVNLNRNALVSANNHNYVVDPGEWSVASGRGFALPASASFAGYYATSSNGNVPLNTLNVDPGNYSENVYYSPAEAHIHVYYEDADNGNNMLPNNSFSDFTSSVNAPFHMSTLGDYQAKFNNQNYHFVGEMHPANGNQFDPNNGETHTIDLLYAPNKPQVPGAKSSIHVHYIDSDDHPVTVNGRVSDNFNNRQAGTAFTMPHISDVAGYQSGNENVINPVTKFSSDNGSVTNVYVQYHKVVPGVQPITVNYISSDNKPLDSHKYTNANTTMSDIQKDINGRTFNNYTHINTLNMPSGFTTHPQTVYVIYRPDHPVTHRGHIHVRYVDENNHDREFWSDKFSDNPGTPFDLRIDNYAVRYVPDRVFDKIISGYTPGHPINFGNQSATDPYVIVVGYAKPKPKSSASATPSSTASSASSKASSASSKASSSVAPSASSSVSSSASQPSSSASRMSSRAVVPPVIPSSQASSQSSVAPQHRSARATNNQPKLKTKQTKPVYIPKNGKGRAIRRQMIREIEKLENLIDQDIRAIQSRVVAVHKYDEHAHKQQMVHEIHIKREDLAKKEVHLRKLKAHKLPQTGESQSYSAMYAMLFVLSSVILAGLGKAIEKRRHE